MPTSTARQPIDPLAVSLRILIERMHKHVGDRVYDLRSEAEVLLPLASIEPPPRYCDECHQRPGEDCLCSPPTFELPAGLTAKLEQPTRPTRRRAGPQSTNTRDADVAELTNRPAKRTRR